MKIVFFTRRFYPDIGGVEKHVLALGQELMRKGHTIIVLAEQSPHDNSNRYVYKGIHVHKISAGKEDWFKKFRIWKELWKLKKVVFESDIVHCHDVFYWYLPFRLLLPSKPVYMTFHGYEGYPISSKAIVVRKISEKLSWGNICIGDFISKWYGTKPTIVSYGAVDDEEIKKKIVITKKLKNESALFFGRLDEQTGIRTYIDAFALLQKKFPKFSFCIVGEGELQNKVPKNAIYKGFQNNPEMYFNEFHFAFISRYLSMLEAFAAKRLVFAVYDNPVKEDYLRLAPFSNWMIISDNAKDLSERVEYYLHHPKEENLMIEKAYNWVTKQTWQKMADNYIRLWKI